MLLTFMFLVKHKPNEIFGTMYSDKSFNIKLRKHTIGAIPDHLMYLKLHLFGCVQLYVLGSVQYTMFVCTVFTNVCVKTCFE